MSDRFMPILFFSLSTLAISPFIVPGIVAQHFTNRDRIEASINLNSDNPIAGKPSTTQLILTANHQPISLLKCNCQVRVHDFRDRPILSDLPLADTTIDGKAAIATAIRFPNPGSYTIVLSGQLQSRKPFELRFPITAVDRNLSY